jgi:hypothetical protein
LCLGGLTVGLAACGSRAHLSAEPAAFPTASFVAQLGTAVCPAGVMSTRCRAPCMKNARFEGIARAVDGALEVRATGLVVMDLRSDKASWSLRLRTEVAQARRSGADRESPEMLLNPTDSAGPSLTVWQSRDSLLLLLPWRRDLTPRWLQFFVAYHAVDHAGNAFDCGAFLATDTLRFGDAKTSGGI